MPKKKTPPRASVKTIEDDLTIENSPEEIIEEKMVVEKAKPTKPRKPTRGRSKTNDSRSSESDENSEWKDNDNVEAESGSDEEEDVIEDPIEILEAAISGDLSEDPVRL